MIRSMILLSFAIWFLHNHIGDSEECKIIRRTFYIVHDYHLVTISANQSSKRCDTSRHNSFATELNYSFLMYNYMRRQVYFIIPLRTCIQSLGIDACTFNVLYRWLDLYTRREKEFHSRVTTEILNALHLMVSTANVACRTIQYLCAVYSILTGRETV